MNKFFGHLKTITKHKWEVFKLSIRAGIPIRGILHDLSKYSPIEFKESVKYYQGGKRSPIPVAREAQGNSFAWLHHKGRNPHHFEYWNDIDAKEPAVMPFKYSVEMICDKIAAGKTYKGKEWTKEYPLEYWNKERKKVIANEKMKKFCDDVFIQLSREGIDKTITKKNLKRLYDKNCVE